MIVKNNIKKCGRTIVFLRRAFSQSSIWPGKEIVPKPLVSSDAEFAGFELYVNGKKMPSFDKPRKKYFVPEDSFLVAVGKEKADNYLRLLKLDVGNFILLQNKTAPKE